MKKRAMIAAALLLCLVGCNGEQQIQERAKTVRACVDAGGSWYNTPGWGENCHFDSRDK